MNKEHKHCWHNHGGTSVSYFTGGDEAVQCCHCGATGRRHWDLREEPLPGHGKYATRTVHVYGEVKIDGQ